jgi:hypothetical protein
MAAKPQAATRRINRGRGHSYVLDNAPADGITKVINDGVPKPNLIDWAARETAGYAVDFWDELAELGVAERLRRLERARFDSVRKAGVRGTDVHELAQRLSSGQPVDVPEHLTGHVDAYLEFVKVWEPDELVVEATVGNRKYGYMGTLDVIARLRDGQLWLLDWKTAGSGIWPENALQLAAYRNAEFMLEPHDGSERLMPTVDRAGCVWLREDGFDLIPVDTGPEVFRLFLYAQQLAHFTAEEKETYIYPAVTPEDAS